MLCRLMSVKNYNYPATFPRQEMFAENVINFFKMRGRTWKKMVPMCS